MKCAVKCKGFLLSKSKGRARACRKEGDIGIFGFAVLAIFSIGFSVFVAKDFAFSVFVPKDFFGLGFRFGLRIFRFLASGFRFS